MKKIILLAVGLLAVCGARPAGASIDVLDPVSGILVTAEDAGVVKSSVLNTHVLDFDLLSLTDTSYDWTGVGSITDLRLASQTYYGGAGPGNFALQGVGVDVTKTTLSLSDESNYFGLWWSAGDFRNRLAFYLDGNLVQEYSAGELFSALQLGDDYKGNSLVLDRGDKTNVAEKYVFLNFYGTRTAWNEVVFWNTTSTDVSLEKTAFESDNWTTRAVPEPSTWACIGMSLCGLLVTTRVRRRMRQ